MILDDIFLVFKALTVLGLFQLIAWPLLLHWSKKFPYIQDKFWAFTRPFFLFSLAFFVWNFSFLKIPLNTDFFVFSFLITATITSLFFWKKWAWCQWKIFWKEKKKLILVEELIFLFAFLFLIFTRSFQPEILSLEKFMDAGFIQAYQKSTTLPAQDMWLAGEGINYYTFGQFYSSLLMRFWQIDIAYAYNLLLATIFAFFCLELFSLAFNLHENLLEKKKKSEKKLSPWSFIAGFLAVIFIALGGNGHLSWYYFSHGNFVGYWFPDATRFIEHTIHEIPAYGFIVSDLHAHVLNLPVVVLFLFILFLFVQEFFSLTSKKKSKNSFWKSPIPIISLLMGGLFSIFAMSNTWDLMTYGLLLIFLGFIFLFKKIKTVPLLLLAAVIVLFTSALGALSWYLSFESIATGIAVAQERSPFWQLAVLWGQHFSLALLAILFWQWLAKKSILKNRATLIFLSGVFLLILTLIIFPEFIYFKDIYTTYPRANTMFKLVFQAFLLMGLLISVFLPSLLSYLQKKAFFSVKAPLKVLFRKKAKISKKMQGYLRRIMFLYLPLSFFLFFSLAYTYQGYKSYYANWKNYQGLDGLAWMKNKYPDDYPILSYLQKINKQENIVEAYGESYTDFARISTFSGMPTILGWQVHEWLWRGSWDIPANRAIEVDAIYNDPSSLKTQKILKKYQIRYIIVGEKEWESFPDLDLMGILSLGETIIQQGRSYLIEIPQ